MICHQIDIIIFFVDIQLNDLVFFFSMRAQRFVLWYQILLVRAFEKKNSSFEKNK